MSAPRTAADERADVLAYLSRQRESIAFIRITHGDLDPEGELSSLEDYLSLMVDNIGAGQHLNEGRHLAIQAKMIEAEGRAKSPAEVAA